jgi:hypothetical protein
MHMFATPYYYLFYMQHKSTSRRSVELMTMIALQPASTHQHDTGTLAGLLAACPSVLQSGIYIQYIRKIS